MRAKKVSVSEILAMSAEEIINRLENGDISLLKSFGANKLRSKMLPVGIVCRFILWLFLIGSKYHGKDSVFWQKKKIQVSNFTQVLFPYTVNNEKGMTEQIPTKEKNGLIIGFNHPTLHEVMSLAAWALKKFINRKNNFSTNLPWYESLYIRANSLRMLGVHITPIITPSTFDKIKKYQRDEAILSCINKTSEKLLSYYLKTAVDFAVSGDNTFAAPSATRQETIFPSKGERIRPVMGMLRLYLMRYAKNAEACFVPITVLPPKKHGKGLNFFRSYKLVVGRVVSVKDLKNSKNFDYEFLTSLAKNAPKNLWYPAVI